jgi:hypothetical protein
MYNETSLSLKFTGRESRRSAMKNLLISAVFALMVIGLWGASGANAMEPESSTPATAPAPVTDDGEGLYCTEEWCDPHCVDKGCLTGYCNGSLCVCLGC